MKSVFKLFSISIFVLLLNTINAKNIYVNDNSLAGDIYTSAVGSAANTGLLPSSPKLTLTSALLLAAPNDVIFVDAGTYNNDVNMTISLNGLTIKGAGSLLTIFDNQNASVGTNIWATVSGSNITLEGFMITKYNNSLSATALMINGLLNGIIRDVLADRNNPSGGDATIVITGASQVDFIGGGSNCTTFWPSVAGGGVNVEGNNNIVTFTDYSFSNNSKDLQGGSGLYVVGISTVTVTNSILADNINGGGNGGAAVYIDGGAVVKFYGTKFSNNVTDYIGGPVWGGAVNMGRYEDVLFNNCSFIGNVAQGGSGRGGGIGVNTAFGSGTTNAIVAVQSCTFSANTANGGNGNDIYNKGATFTVDNSYFVRAATNIVQFSGSFSIQNSSNPASTLTIAPIISGPYTPINTFTPTGIPIVNAPVLIGGCYLCANAIPTGASTQTFCSNPAPQISNLAVSSGTNTVWYNASTGGTAYTSTTSLVSGQVYYASNQASGCSASPRFSVTVTIVTPTVSFSAISDSVLCSGNSTTLTPSSNLGGANTYTLISSTQTLTTFPFVVSPVSNTTYTLIGTSSSGCVSSNTAITTITVIATPTVSISSASNPTICSGASIVLTASGATNYAWLPATNLSSTTSSVVTASPTVTIVYTVTGTSTAGCVATKTTVVTVNPSPSAAISSSSTNPTCGLNNGVIVINNTSLVGGPFTFSSSSGTLTGQTVSGLGAGTVTFSVTNTFGCTFTISATLTMTPGPSSMTIVPTNATCGNNNGSFTITGTAGGTPTYSYAINNGAFSTATITSNLAPGTYSVTVKDANGCSSLTQITTIVATSTPTAITGNSSPASCSGSTGSYTVTGVSGGVGTYSYSIDGGAFSTSTIITNLSPGTHTIAVKDANGCAFPFQTTFSVGVVAGITSATVNPSSASCGTANATATVTTILGGTPSYSFSFDGGTFTGTSSITGLAAGNHTVIIRDVNTCTLSVPFTVSSAGSPTTSITSFSNVTCFGLSNGSCTVAIPAGGGTGPYTYTLTSPFQIAGPTTGDGVFINLPAGDYNISVEDEVGCISTTSVNISQPTTPTLTVTSFTVKCFGTATGTINVVGSGGTPTYSYNLNGGAYQTSSTFSNQLAGIYTMGIKDANGCIATQTVQITQPTVLSIAVSSQSANCTAANGIASATVSGGIAPYTYNWTPIGGTAAASNPMVGGTYTITATDANTCSINSPVLIGVALGGTATITSSADVTCFGANNGSITIGMNGGSAPFTYSWSPGGQTTQSAVNLSPGTYTCVVTDFFGCQSTIVKVITQPTFSLTLGVSSNDVKCFGTSTGTVTAAASGGTLPYSYLWPTIPSTVSTVPNVPTGTYTVICTDANGCVKSATIEVTEPLAISLTSNVTPANCGLADGSATVTASGGVSGAYTYTWSSGSNAATQGSLLAGTYTITVKDANNCIQTLAATIPSTSGPTISVTSQTNAICFGGTTGAIATTVSGGTGNYTYAWSNGATNSVATNLSAGLYTVSATDQVGCVTSTFVTISQPTASLTVNILASNPTCFGATDGFGAATANGGTPSYTYAWTSNGGTAATSNQLGAGNYNLTVTDANGCIAISTMSLINPLAMSTSVTFTNVTCNGNCNGIATATNINGFGSVSYFWTGMPNPIASQTAIGLCAGTYTVLATDQNNCTASSQVVITQPTQIIANITSTGSVTCNGGNNGFASVSPSGGTGAYTYSWLPSGGTAANANTLAAGIYTVTVKDANLCSGIAIATIVQPTPLATTLTTSDVNCNGVCDGTANIIFSGGTGPTTFQWFPNLQSGNFVNNLCAGSNTVIITSNGICTSSISFVLIQPAILTAVTSATNSNCGQNNGQVCATVTGGTGQLSFQWSNGTTTLCNNNLPAAAYNFIVTDINGCTAAASGIVNDVAGPVVSILSQTNASCYGGANGAVATTITGGVPNYTVTWSTGQTTQNVTNFTAGIKNITVVDAAGCSASAFVTITQPTQQLVSAVGSSTNVTCFGLSNGAASVLAAGGTAPYSYTWTPSAQTNSTLVNVAANTYTVNVKDVNGCLSSQQVIISQPQALVLASSSSINISCFGGSNGQISTAIQGGTPGYTYSWLPSGSGSVLAGLTPGVYSLTVVDANNCSIDDNFNITAPSAPLTSTYSSSPATCNLTNGSATVTIAGGTPGYNIVWNTAGLPTGAIATNIGPGSGWIANITDSKGCTFTQTVSIASTPVPIITGFNTLSPTCFGVPNGAISVNYASGSAPYTVSWSNPISQTTTSSALTQSVSGVASGVYTTTLTDGNGCSVSSSTVVTQPANLVLFTSQNASICFGNITQISASASGGSGAYSYTWSPNIGIGGGPHTVNPIGLTSYSVSVSDTNGCLASPKIISINVSPPLLASGFVFSKCDGDVTMLTPNITSPGKGAPYDFIWSTGLNDFTVSNSSINVTANFLSAPNTYSVLINDGCTTPLSIAVFTVNVNASPIIDFTGVPLQGCAPLTVTLTGTSDGATDIYTWSGNKIQSNIAGNPYYVTLLDSGKYSITLTVSNPITGCSASQTKTDYIEVYSQPIAAFYSDPQVVNILDPNFNFINTSQGAISYYWHFGDPSANNVSNTSILTNPSHAYTNAGTYDVNLVATSLKGCKDTAMLKVEVTPDFSLYIPNAFTPDGNGLNDVFQPLGVGIDEDNYSMDIYDRWGEIIFTSDNFRKGWNGYVKGNSKIAPQGVYIYKIKLEDVLGNKLTRVGHVTVIAEN